MNYRQLATKINNMLEEDQDQPVALYCSYDNIFNFVTRMEDSTPVIPSAFLIDLGKTSFIPGTYIKF